MERFGISPGGQGAEFLGFCGVGILLAALYDLFRLWRVLTSPPPRRVFFQDLLFFVLAAALTQLGALPVSRGKIRLFHLLAIGLGGLVYGQTAGRLTLPLFRLIRRGWEGLGRAIARPADRMARFWKKKRASRQKNAKKQEKN